MNPLLSEIVASNPSSLVVAPANLARWWTERFRHEFVASASPTWWWQDLTVNTTRHDYGQGDGLTAIGRIVDGWGPAVLIVTDEEPDPLGCIVGLAADLVDALREIRNCEFILATPTLDRWVFDTHANVAHEFATPS